MMNRLIKNVPMSATKSTATLVCPSGFTDELPSSWYNLSSLSNYINVTICDKKEARPHNLRNF